MFTNISSRNPNPFQQFHYEIYHALPTQEPSLIASGIFQCTLIQEAIPRHWECNQFTPMDKATIATVWKDTAEHSGNVSIGIIPTF